VKYCFSNFKNTIIYCWNNYDCICNCFSNCICCDRKLIWTNYVI